MQRSATNSHHFAGPPHLEKSKKKITTRRASELRRQPAPTAGLWPVAFGQLNLSGCAFLVHQCKLFFGLHLCRYLGAQKVVSASGSVGFSVMGHKRMFRSSSAQVWARWCGRQLAGWTAMSGVETYHHCRVAPVGRFPKPKCCKTPAQELWVMMNLFKGWPTGWKYPKIQIFLRCITSVVQHSLQACVEKALLGRHHVTHPNKVMAVYGENHLLPWFWMFCKKFHCLTWTPTCPDCGPVWMQISVPYSLDLHGVTLYTMILTLIHWWSLLYRKNCPTDMDEYTDIWIIW